MKDEEELQVSLSLPAAYMVFFSSSCLDVSIRTDNSAVLHQSHKNPLIFITNLGVYTNI